jgi:hypothetical protein
MTNSLSAIFRSLLLRFIVVFFLFVGYAFGDSHSMNCSWEVPSPHAKLAEGDQSTATHLEARRQVSNGAEINIDVCSADVTITGSDDNTFHFTVDLGSSSEKHSAVDYLETFDVTPKEIRLQLHLPKSIHAKVTIEVPNKTEDVHTNVARGSVRLVGDRIAGERELNLGYGYVNFEGNKDAYANMQVNVGMGSMHDHRRDGEDHHFIVARSLEGTGKGSVEINVGMGSVDLNPGRSQPI